VERIGESHANLGHAVAFEEGVAGDFAPAVKGAYGSAAEPEIMRRKAALAW